MPLSEKERRFVSIYAQTGDPAQAATEAGYKDRAGFRTAKRVLAKEEARAWLADCRSRDADGKKTTRPQGGKGRKPATVSLESLTEELEEARRRAVDAGQSSAAIAATMGKAKLHGLDGPKSKAVAAKSPERIERVIVDPEDTDGQGV